MAHITVLRQSEDHVNWLRVLEWSIFNNYIKDLTYILTTWSAFCQVIRSDLKTYLLRHARRKATFGFVFNSQDQDQYQDQPVPLSSIVRIILGGDLVEQISWKTLENGPRSALIVFYAAFNNCSVVPRRFLGKSPVLLLLLHLSWHQRVNPKAIPILLISGNS